MKIKEKVFVVSGGSSGLGKATSELLIENGGKVIVLDRNPNSENLVIEKQSNLYFHQCDVRNPEQVMETIDSGVSHFGRLDGAIACAGIAPAISMQSSRHGSHSFEDFMNVLIVNVGGTFNLFNAVIPFIKSNDPSIGGERGNLIATSSIAAYEGQIGQVAYAASKGGVASMVLPLARELARSSIRVNGIAPGIFQTPMVEGFPEEVQTALGKQVPFPNRLGSSGEFAQLVLHILKNNYLNGTVIRLDGAIRMSPR